MEGEEKNSNGQTGSGCIENFKTRGQDGNKE